MSCLEFRRTVLADPAAADVTHARDCTACAAFLADQQRLTQQLRSVMRVPAPPALADRIVFAHAMRAAGARRWRGPALAAGFVAAVALGLVAYQPVSLASQVAEHIRSERLEADPTDPQAAADFARIVATLGGVARRPPALLQAALCETAEHRPGLHLVVADGGRAVTIFVLPHDAPRLRVPLRAGTLHGWLIPHAGVGIAVLSEQDIDPARYVRMMDEAIAWPA